eukprot:TRINITY_DN20730_c4_g1_i1.p1 TRINITY_DN20730_c4_g1~~TRINITY_DN20730_c4_g1_i1.p1  ORF type:complete len:444 (+),score=98.97 TRINITY_DN20730_c4_g1_i1:104-1435(+)
MSNAKTFATPEAAGDERVNLYFLFICASTLARSFEAGIVASMMPSIKSSMELNYTNVGTIAASPDIGIVASGLIAATVFKYFGVYKVLTPAYFCIGLTAILCGSCPSLWTLCIARAMGGLFWGFAAIHYPVWINARCMETKTVRLAIFQLTLLGGILVGYAVGDAAEASGFCSWTALYTFEGLMMVLCGAFACSLPSDLVAARKADGGNSPASPQQQNACIAEEVRQLCGNPLFVFAMAQIVAGAALSTFVLYFCANLEKTLGISQFDRVGGTIIAFIMGPLGGTLGGAKFVSTFKGGYQNYRRTTQFSLVCACTGLFGVVGVALSTIYFCKWSFFGFIILSFMVGIAPVAPLNGIVVSVNPEAAHYASSIQFTLANFGKFVVPQVAGIVVDQLGVVAGFDATLIAMQAVAAFTSLGAFLAARAAAMRSKEETEGLGQALLAA